MAESIQVKQAYIQELTTNLPTLERKANEAIKSFADLVSELNKVSNLSNGTPVKEQVSKLTGELNNSSVFFTKMIAEELGKLHGIVNPIGSNETEIKI